MSHRLEQLTSAIDRAVREVMARGFSDPRITGLITVTSVKVLPDLSQAFINISVLPEEKQDLTFHGLVSAAPFIRREVGDIVNARVLPQFTFRLDTTLKKEAAILRELDKVREDIAKTDARLAAKALADAAAADATVTDPTTQAHTQAQSQAHPHQDQHQ